MDREVWQVTRVSIVLVSCFELLKIDIIIELLLTLWPKYRWTMPSITFLKCPFTHYIHHHLNTWLQFECIPFFCICLLLKQLYNRTNAPSQNCRVNYLVEIYWGFLTKLLNFLKPWGCLFVLCTLQCVMNKLKIPDYNHFLATVV